MNFIELFKEQFYFIGCDITTEIRNHREIKITTFPKKVLKKVVELANNTNNTNIIGSSWIDEYKSCIFYLHEKNAKLCSFTGF